MFRILSYHFHITRLMYSLCVKEPPLPPALISLHTPPLTILLHYELVVTDFPFSPDPLINPVFTKEVVVFWQQC